MQFFWRDGFCILELGWRQTRREKGQHGLNEIFEVTGSGKETGNEKNSSRARDLPLRGDIGLHHRRR
jgi:hypothetical protein